MNFRYKTKGTCSQRIDFTLDDDNTITNVQFMGGCNGNLQGISRLVIGRKAEDVINTLSGVSCGGRPTSCPDQLACALQRALDSKKEEVSNS